MRDMRDKKNIKYIKRLTKILMVRHPYMIFDLNMDLKTINNDIKHYYVSFFV